jgi:hypothetical protein
MEYNKFDSSCWGDFALLGLSRVIYLVTKAAMIYRSTQ